MYIAVIPNRNSPPAILLRESVRSGGKVKNITRANLSNWPPARIEMFRRVLKGEFDAQAPEPMDGELVCGKAVGALWAAHAVARELGIVSALGRGKGAALGLLLVLARLLDQGSRLSAVRWAAEQAVGEVLGLGRFDEDDLYAALDDLAESQEKIEQKLFRKRHGNRPPTLFLYDVTSSYLEGDKNELGTWGYNRDKKEGKQQIVIGLLTDGAGDPVAVRVFEGNTSDPQTVEEQVRTLTQNFGVKEVTLVGDRGMLKGPQIDKLPEGFRYITAITKPQIRSLLADGVLQLSLFDEQVCEIEHAVESETAGGESDSESEAKREGKPTVVRYILKRNPKRAQELAVSRQARLDRLRAFVEERNAHLVAHGKAGLPTALKAAQDKARRLNLHGFTGIEAQDRVLWVRVDEAACEEQAQLDGCYALKTDLPQTTADAETVHARYKDLAQVEADFRALKTGGLEIRPLFVRKASRTRGHVFVTMLALLLRREIERLLRVCPAPLPTHNPAEALRLLDRLSLVEWRVGDLSLARLPRPNADQQAVLEALGLSLPQTLPRM